MNTPPVDDTKLAGDAPGFFGKLPSHRDFLSRRLSPDLLAPWGEWLDSVVADSREALGDTWLATYLLSPIWCFAVSCGCCGERSFAGVLMPSLDRVGRYYPLSILAPIEGDASAAEIAAEATQWFARMEAAALSCLADDFNFAVFDATLAAEPLPSAQRSDDAAGRVVSSPLEPGATLPRLLGRLLEQHGAPYSLWWTAGSEAVAPGCRAFPGLPPPEDFHKLLGQRRGDPV
jgi:type VI secretion system protein ImpM